MKICNWYWGLLTCLIPWLFSTAAFGQCDPAPVSRELVLFQQIPSVVGASRYEQKITEAPANVTIITANDIKKFGYRNLTDILNSVPGFFVTYDRNYHYLGFRGFNRPGDYNTRFLLLIDGHRLNDNIYDEAFIETDFPVDVDLLDRVEVIRGPASSLYGTSAFFGVINLITKRGRDLKGPEVSGAVQSFGTYKARGTYGDRFSNDLEILVSGSYLDSAGQKLFFPEFNSPASHYGITRDSDFEQNYSIFSKVSWRDLTLSGAYFERDKGIPTGSFDTIFNDPGNRTRDGRYFLDLKYEHEFPRQIGVMARLFYDYSHYFGDYIYNTTDPLGNPTHTLNHDYSYGEWWGGEFQINKKFWKKHTVIAGFELRDNLRQEQGNYDNSPYFVFLKDRRRSTIWAPYLQGELALRDNLRLTAGVRYDHYSTFGGTTNPRAALIYNPFSKTYFKFIYGQAFRAPNAYELYYSDGDVTQKANPRLQPEKIRTFELIWEQYLGRSLRLVGSGFYYSIHDLISQVTDPATDLIVFQNLERVDTMGLEWQLEGRWAGGWETRLSYTYQQAKDLDTGQILSNSPRHLAKFNLIVPLWQEKIFGGVELQYMSNRRTLLNNQVNNVFITNLTLFSQRLWKKVEFSASVYNLFDRKFQDPGGQEHLSSGMDAIRQDGRNFRVKLTIPF